jgi:hypothetical protein
MTCGKKKLPAITHSIPPRAPAPECYDETPLRYSVGRVGVTHEGVAAKLAPITDRI